MTAEETTFETTLNTTNATNATNATNIALNTTLAKNFGDSSDTSDLSKSSSDPLLIARRLAGSTVVEDYSLVYLPDNGEVLPVLDTLSEDICRLADFQALTGGSHRERTLFISGLETEATAGMAASDLPNATLPWREAFLAGFIVANFEYLQNVLPKKAGAAGKPAGLNVLLFWPALSFGEFSFFRILPRPEHESGNEQAPDDAQAPLFRIESACMRLPFLGQLRLESWLLMKEAEKAGLAIDEENAKELRKLQQKRLLIRNTGRRQGRGDEKGYLDGDLRSLKRYVKSQPNLKSEQERLFQWLEEKTPCAFLAGEISSLPAYQKTVFPLLELPSCEVRTDYDILGSYYLAKSAAGDVPPLWEQFDEL